MLLMKVVDLDHEHGAVFQRFGEREAGRVDVGVGLDDLVVLHDDHAVAERAEIGAEQIGAAVILLADDELGAVAELDVLGAEGGEVRLFLGGGRCGGGGHARGGTTKQIVEHGLQYHDITRAARVHDTGLFQHGVELDRFGERLMPRLDGGLQHGLHIGGVLGKGHRSLGSTAADGQNSALGGLHHGLIRRVHAGLHGDGKLGGGGGFQALQPLGKTTEQQACDNAGVAASATELGGGNTVGCL